MEAVVKTTTESTTSRREHHIESKSRDSDDNNAIEEELYVLTEEDVNQGVKELVAIMKKFNISEDLQNKPSAHAKGSDVRVHID